MSWVIKFSFKNVMNLVFFISSKLYSLSESTKLGLFSYLNFIYNGPTNYYDGQIFILKK